MKHLSILGATGSIGQNTLKIAGMFPDRFTVCALAAKTNITRLAQQITRFEPDLAAVYDHERAEALKKILPAHIKTEVVYGDKGYRAAASHENADTVVSAMVGAAGLLPTLAAIESGKTIALANKETLVMAGDVVMRAVAKQGAAILPVDSEHSAIFQCLQGIREQDVDHILLTASGGPFLHKPADEFHNITLQDALKHPNWQMGQKITIDSATLMNKGLEVIEAVKLFGLPAERIKVVVHPESIIHSMVACVDGSVIAQMGVPDMKGAISYALSYPERLNIKMPVPDFFSLGSLTFHEPDMEKFPCLALAFKACESGGTMTAVLNAANEIAVTAFLDQKIAFTAIPDIIKKTMDAHEIIKAPDLATIIEADRWAREQAWVSVQLHA